MTRLPLRILHERLDRALARFPDRATLGEYRAPDGIVEDEWSALAEAETIVTPHTEIASHFGERARLLPWALPAARATAPADAIAFPGPTAARKGAHEVRDVARRLDLEVVLGGSELEGTDFWKGVRTRRATRERCLEGVCAVVQPALVEDQPRALLAAIAAGVPAITTTAAGLGERPGVTCVEYGDTKMLAAAIDGIRSGNYANMTP